MEIKVFLAICKRSALGRAFIRDSKRKSKYQVHFNRVPKNTLISIFRVLLARGAYFVGSGDPIVIVLIVIAPLFSVGVHFCVSLSYSQNASRRT